MGTNRQDEGRERLRLQLITEQESHDGTMHEEAKETDLVFDFTNVHSPDFADLSLILTARLQARPQDRVWVRALPPHTWRILRALGLDHLFRDYPGPNAEPN